MGWSKRRPSRPNATGRSEKLSRFARLPHKVLSSNAYRSCSTTSRALLVELTMLENGSNNGSLYLSVRSAADRVGVADLTAISKAFDELQARGLIAMTKDAHFNIKAADQSRARCWRLTWLGVGRKMPTNEYASENAEPPSGSKERKRMEAGARALKIYRKARDSARIPVLDSNILMGLDVEPAQLPVLDSDIGS